MPTTEKLIHTFESLADLGQEVAGTGDFNEMVRTSLHLLLGTLALRRGAVVECLPDQQQTRCLCRWGLEDNVELDLKIDSIDRKAFLDSGPLQLNGGAQETFSTFLMRYSEDLRRLSIEVVVPMVVHGELTGLVLLGGKASGERFGPDDLNIIRAMVRHIGVGIHSHRLLEQIEQRAEENRRLYEELKAIYADTVRAFAAAIDIKDKYTQGHSERVGKYSELISPVICTTWASWSWSEISSMLHTESTPNNLVN
jgi:hypothetical protein